MIALICGGMWSGKTTELFRRLRRAQHAGQRTVLYKYSKDVRYGRRDMASSHDNIHEAAIPVSHLDTECIVPNTVIGIDEGQFMGNLVPFCEAAANQGCTVIVAALDSDFKREGFPNIQELFPKCEKVYKLHAVCFKCKGEASFTKRRDASVGIVEDIGADDKYLAVCRKCHK
jgi:thymidine kinase